MFEGMLFYIFVCLAFFAIGDFLGVATKAKVSSVFVSLLLFLVFFMADWIPADVINQAGLTQIGKWAVGFVVFGMGTTINMRELMAEWRTVATACLSMAVIWIGMIVLVPLIGYNETIVTIPIINGGIVATQIMTSAAMENGLEMAAALGTIIYFSAPPLLLISVCAKRAKCWRFIVKPVSTPIRLNRSRAKNRSPLLLKNIRNTTASSSAWASPPFSLGSHPASVK